MKRQIMFVTALAVIAIGAYWGQKLVNQKSLSDLQLANIEALTQEEYTIGMTGTNWKTYRIECTITVGFDYILCITKTYKFWTDACGSGMGFCLSSVGC